MPMKSDELAQHHPSLRRRRLAIGGGSQLDTASTAFFKILGRELAAEPGLVLVTGGLKHLRGKPDNPCADWAVIQGALDYLSKAKIAAADRIETWYPEYPSIATVERFYEGAERRIPNTSSQARRFKFVQASDALLTIAGGPGTQSVIDMALAIDRPVLPLPFAGGASRDRWDENRKVIQQLFEITDDQASYLEALQLDELDEEGMGEVAAKLRPVILRGLRRKCFVVMRFSDTELPLYNDVIREAILESQLFPLRADEVHLPGNAHQALWMALETCDCILADITAANPNVMYELGFAHALRKPVVILHRGADAEFLSLPFDVRSERMIRYDNDFDNLKREIVATLGSLRTT